MKRIFFTVLILIISLSLCSCGKKVVNSVADELRCSTWKYQNDTFDISATISFENENAAFTINNGNESCTVSGLCITNDNNIIIVDNEVQKEYLFTYNLIGNSVIINYNNCELTFEKE